MLQGKLIVLPGAAAAGFCAYNSLIDYLGWFESLYPTELAKEEVYKENGTYYFRWQYPDNNTDTPAELIPTADGTSFMMDDAFSFCYDTELMRYELSRAPKREPRLLIRHPLVRIDAPLSDTYATTNDITVIGFPFAKD